MIQPFPVCKARRRVSIGISVPFLWRYAPSTLLALLLLSAMIAS